MQKGTSSSEKIILEPSVIELRTQEDIKGSGRATDVEMGQIRLETTVEVENNIIGVSEPPPGGASSPHLAKAHSAGVPCYQQPQRRVLDLQYLERRPQGSALGA